MIAWGRCGQVERMGGGSWWKPSSRRELRWRAESARGLRRLEVVTGFGRSGCGDRVGAPPRPPPLQPTSALGSRDFLPAGGGPGCGQCCEDFYQASCLLRTWGASSTERGGDRLGAAMNVDHEVNLLVEEIHRLGSKNADGKLSVKFGVLFRDDKCANLFEALVGTLKAAKRRKIITYPGELLLQGVHDDVDIILLQD